MENCTGPKPPGLGIVIACVLLFTLASTGFCVITPHFLVDSEMEWAEALATLRVTPMPAGQWATYMNQWANEVWREGMPAYPAHQFVMPTLYVYPGGGGGELDPEDAGLVMVWRPTSGNSFSSAWRYNYMIDMIDPDLSNSTINVTVTAPQFDPLGNQINVVSFGIMDVTGATRAWYWNVGPGQPILWNVPTTVTINTAVLGPGAATPVATSYVNNPSFQMTQVQWLIVDENAQWVGGQMPVPPGGQVQGLWNYWHNLTVTPNIPPKTTDPLKWSQPPVEAEPGLNPPLFYGWDESSMYYQGSPIVADDWECKDGRPITDIHWWGSFLGWTQPYPPPLPDAFHIAIWTDVPAGSGFSHPGTLIWQNYCTTYGWNFAGYDKDPFGRPEYENEACFQFFQKLKPEEWFYQDPGKNSVYWLSIAAVYTDGSQYRWGWKTRPHFFNDDAVRIWQVSPGWPPTVGSQWLQGQEIILGDQSWDLAFELTTNEELPTVDWGDAPDGVTAPGYPTLSAHNGANHVIVPGMFLGYSVDAEGDGQPNANATGDDLSGVPNDEDGVNGGSSLVPGQAAWIDVTASASGMLNAWIDFNGDGSWTQSGDHIIIDKPLVAGLNLGISFMVPPTATPGTTFARLRFSSVGGLLEVGPAPDGEVEDHEVTIQEPQQPKRDFGDAPDSLATPQYPTLAANNGASHTLSPNLYLGARVDTEPDGQPDAAATGDDNDGNDDEDGVVFTSALVPGQTATVQVTSSASGRLDAWVEFTGDSDWADYGEQIIVSQPVIAGPNVFSFVVPASAIAGNTCARFRLSSVGGLMPTGPAHDGEVEDYLVTIEPKWLQAPDTKTTGIGVNATAPYILADDFPCTVTGPITQITVWGSWLRDMLPMDADGNPDPSLVAFTLSIHKDIPAQGDLYSRPGDVLWVRNFGPGDFRVVQAYENVDEGWMTPPDDYTFPGDHNIWQYTFDLKPEDYFIQTGSREKPVVYWLDVQAVHQGAAAAGCILPDNGTGTADLPPVGCAYTTPNDDMRIVDGLAPGTTIEIDATHTNFVCSPTGGICSFPAGANCREPGGTLGGEKECFESQLLMPMVGTGSLASFSRMITMPLSFEVHVGPRTLGDPVQSFAADMFRMFGQITGDPDFDLLRITAGTDFGLPSPGHTTLTRLPSGDWAVDSFFDITYRIDFVGAPGGPLSGMSGSTTGTVRFQIPTGETSAARFGWKTSLDHWNDDAVWGQGNEPYIGPWHELRYPPQHEMYKQSIDLAFAIDGKALDFGDAPDSYRTKLVSTGAHHIISPNLYLGASVDSEPDGQPDPTATGDDNDGNDDEDGAFPLTPFVPGAPAKIHVTASAAGILNGWLDFDGDGTWSQSDEHILIDKPLAAGPNILDFNVPITAKPGPTFARLRFSSVGGLTYAGLAPDGEVEDYDPTIEPKPEIVNKGAAKKLPVGTYVLVEEDVVTANFGRDGWYFEEPDRSAGLGVLPASRSAAWLVDDLVSCYGFTTLSGCELMLQEIYSWQVGDGTVGPVGQSNRGSGGGSFGFQPGLFDDVGVPKPAYGLNTVALLVKLWGRCTHIETDASGGQLNFWIDDGSNLWDGTTKVTGDSVRGVKVKVPSAGLTTPMVENEYYSVVGIMRTYNSLSGGQCVRWLWPRDSGDIVSWNTLTAP